jgi:hypothetical protein
VARQEAGYPGPPFQTAKEDERKTKEPKTHTTTDTNQPQRATQDHMPESPHFLFKHILLHLFPIWKPRLDNAYWVT